MQKAKPAVATAPKSQPAATKAVGKPDAKLVVEPVPAVKEEPKPEVVVVASVPKPPPVVQRHHDYLKEDKDLKINGHLLEETVFKLIHEADKAIVEVDNLITDLSKSVLTFRDFPKRTRFEMQLDAELIQEDLESRFKQQKVEYGILEREIQGLESTSRAEKELLEVLMGKTRGLERKVGAWSDGGRGGKAAGN